MAHKDGEASVEDILRSIKQVISREDGPRTAPVRREGGEPPAPGGEPPSSFTPYSFTRPSPFGSRHTEVTPSYGEPSESEEGEEEDDGARTDVFDLKSLDSEALELDGDAGEPEASEGAALSSPEPEAARVVEIVPPSLPPVSETETGHYASPYRDRHGFGASTAAEDEDETASEGETSEEPTLAEVEAVDEPEPEIVLEAPEEIAALPEPEEPAAVAETLAVEVEAEAEPEYAPADADSLIASAAASSLRDRFAELQSVATTPVANTPPPAPNPLEEMVRDMMRPLLKQWLDDNMPGLVEKIVEREIARITGRL